MNLQEQKKLINRLNKLLSTYIKEGQKVIIGLSGGADSIFLCHVLHKLKIPTIAAHLNHNLRGRESNNDQKFVENFCKTHSIPLELKNLDIKSLSQKHKEGLEERGRKERYKLFDKLKQKHKAKYILTAHHADDNIETVILNLVRGSGLDGLAGMKILDNHLLRPLLDISKNQILSYLNANKINYVDEESNKDTKFRRNFIRQNIIPNLKELNPNLASTIAKNSKNIREIDQYLSSVTDKWINKNGSTFDAKAFYNQDSTIQKIILRKIYKNLINDLHNIETKHLDEILDLINKNIGNKKKKFGLLTVHIKSGIISLEKN